MFHPSNTGSLLKAVDVISQWVMSLIGAMHILNNSTGFCSGAPTRTYIG